MSRRARTTLAWRIAASLAAGVVVTVAVAWGCACWSPAVVQSRTDSLASGWPPARSPQLSAELREWVPAEWLHPSSEHPAAYLSAFEERGRGFGIQYDLVEIQEPVPPARKSHPDSFVSVLRCGWPAKSLGCSVRSQWASTPSGMPPFDWRFGLPIPELFGAQRLEAGVYLAGTNHSRRAPLLPLWPGFALNAGFYGAFVFAIWSAPGFARRRIRVRRGLCAFCGYDLRGSANRSCPECGT